MTHHRSSFSHFRLLQAGRYSSTETDEITKQIYYRRCFLTASVVIDRTNGQQSVKAIKRLNGALQKCLFMYRVAFDQSMKIKFLCRSYEKVN